MNQILKRTFLPGLMAVSLAGVTLVPAKPATADDQVIRDAAIGAGTCVVTGAIRRRGTVLRNAAKCAAAGAVVNGANGLRRNPKKRSIIQDAAVGAGTSAGTRAILGGREDTAGDLLDGAAAGAVINILGR
ncbi:MAG: hypothetical protein KME21_19425 [Desmonostoc vinosum HA7617-LM4]|jgi:hypothetical protein|nr:hypothetical protein [Desmonostoc vinosum HA7617-LM4]